MATAHSGALWQANQKTPESLGIFTSSVFDAGATAQIGYVSWEPMPTKRIQVRVRTGHSNNPNEGWDGGDAEPGVYMVRFLYRDQNNKEKIET